MDKWIHVEYPYGKITLDFSRMAPKPVLPLTARRWLLLERAERVLYGREQGAHGWTDVMSNDGDAFLNQLWEQAYTASDATVETNDRDTIETEVARRVAAALAVLSFGREFLLK